MKWKEDLSLIRDLNLNILRIQTRRILWLKKEKQLAKLLARHIASLQKLL